MIKVLFKHFKELISRILVLLAWLIVLDICTKLHDLPAILCGFISLGVFFFLHVKHKKPDNWDFNRLKFVKPNNTLLLMFTAVLLVFGDVFWLYHTKTSTDVLNSESSSIDFLVLAVLAFPVIEEFGFRLWLQSYIEFIIPPILAIIIVALGFGFLHQPKMPIPQILAGLFYGILLVKTKSIWIPVLLHIFQNGLLILSGEIESVQNVSLELMDKPGNANLYIAISFWVLASICIFIWWYLSNKKIRLET